MFRYFSITKNYEKNTIVPIAHVAMSCKKLMILSRTEYLIIFTSHRYRRTSTTVSSPFMRGAAPGDACRLFGHATTPYDMYEGPVGCSSGIATSRGPPSRLTL